MSRSSGAGRPIHFVCANARRWNAPTIKRHVVTLTGKSRSAGGGAVGRSSSRAREYVCACGHRGWSRHVDLERREKAS